MDLNTAKLLRDFGVKDITLAARLTQQVGAVVTQREQESLVPITNANLAAVQEIGPRDGVKALLVTQMVAVHNMAMEHLRRLAIDQRHIEITDSIANRATKLLGTFTAQVETLNRYRNAGKQVITVNNIGQVNAETAAIAVGCTTGGLGAHPQNQGEPHVIKSKIIENLAPAPFAPLPGDEQAHETALPGRGDGERSLLPSWGTEPRRAQRKSA